LASIGDARLRRRPAVAVRAERSFIERERNDLDNSFFVRVARA
jgi:hypothetical protein